MGTPAKKFNQLSLRQQRRRIRALSDADIDSIRRANGAKNGAPNPVYPLCVPQIPDHVVNEANDSFHDLEPLRNEAHMLVDVEDMNFPIATTNAQIDAEIPVNVRIQSEGDETDLRGFLAHWSIKNKLPKSVINELLVGLQKFGHPELPSDARSLCHTPQKIELMTLGDGTYSHYGLERALKEQLQFFEEQEIPATLRIDINIDGLPLSKSSGSNLWPLLGRIVGMQSSEPFLIAAFHGKGKPSSAAEFLQQFMIEYTKLRDDGFSYNNQQYFVNLNAVIADTPARNFVSCFPAHNSRCAKCLQEGKTVNRRRIFEHENVTLRTNATFRAGLPESFQNIESPFEIIGVDMIEQFPLDYMHLLCLGVMKKLLSLWICGMGKSKEALNKLSAFNDFYRMLAPSLPTEFSRDPRSLDEMNRWKATELRLFLLYLGPVAVQYLLTLPQVIHFQALNCAVRILCDPREHTRNNRYAQELMMYFVSNMKLLYGEETMTFNAHNLIHISADVLNHGPLDAFSCFPFENFLHQIKLMIKGGAQPLAQIMKRLTERSMHLNPPIPSVKKGFRLNKIDTKKKHPLPEGYTDSHGEIQFPDFLLTNESPNNCCYLLNGNIVLIERICYRGEIPVIIGRKFVNTKSLANYPCDSKLLGMVEGGELSESETWAINQIDRKGFVIPHNGISAYIFPLIHSA